jgi:hypothetical protein
LAATYITLIEKGTPDAKRKQEIIAQLCRFLDKGHTYADIRNAMLDDLHKRRPFPLYQFATPCKKQDVNLLKQGVMYYHKQLKLMNSLPVINHDIDSGTMTSSKVEFYLEPVASYTMSDLLTYFYSKNMADVQEYNPKRMAGMFRHMIDKYGLDKLLFMIEGAARMYESEQKVFTLTDFDAYSSTASQYLEEIKNNCKYSGGDKYVYRKRVLPC